MKIPVDAEISDGIRLIHVPQFGDKIHWLKYDKTREYMMHLRKHGVPCKMKNGYNKVIGDKGYKMVVEHDGPRGMWVHLEHREIIYQLRQV